jgi:hypothetical protein
VLRRIFGPKRNEVTGGWRKLLSKELYNLHSSPSIIRMIKLRKRKRAGHVARMYIGSWWESQKQRDHEEDLDIGRWIILKWILER